MLDGRTNRDEQTRTAEMDAPDRTVLGDDEEQWLMSELERSEATWRLVGNDVMIGQVFTDYLSEELGEPLSEVGVLTKREHGPEPDQWDGYRPSATGCSASSRSVGSRTSSSFRATFTPPGRSS